MTIGGPDWRKRPSRSRAPPSPVTRPSTAIPTTSNPLLRAARAPVAAKTSVAARSSASGNGASTRSCWHGGRGPRGTPWAGGRPRARLPSLASAGACRRDATNHEEPGGEKELRATRPRRRAPIPPALHPAPATAVRSSEMRLAPLGIAGRSAALLAVVAGGLAAATVLWLHEDEELAERRVVEGRAATLAEALERSITHAMEEHDRRRIAA